MSGVLYVVATPIGNLEDLSFRAVRVLKEVDLIAAEDTRHTKILLAHYGINTPLTSYHEHNERAKSRYLVERLIRGENVALVSDAGTPAISDPGYRLVVEAIQAGIQVTPVPGASALTAVLSASGLPTDRFIFEGFLPAKKNERRRRLRALRAEVRTLIFYESPHRLKESLQDSLEVLGDREVVLAREISKIHEEFLRGPLSHVIREIVPREIMGETTLLVRGAEKTAAPSEDRLREEIRELQAAGVRVKEIAQLLGARHGYSKKAIYRMAMRRDD
jgi:16S rRNA (cytidine1402-2'-O)-methyltransferase